MIAITLDLSSHVPPFEQVRAQLAGLINRRVLVAGARLPTVRHLARELSLSIGTVARAYQELETAGLVVTDGRRGTTVRATDDAIADVTAHASSFAKSARAAGLSEQDAIRIVRAAWAR